MQFNQRVVTDAAFSVDMLVFAFDSLAPATVVIITGDRGFMYAASTLRMRGHRVVLIMPSGSTSTLLKDGVDVIVSWQDVLEQPVTGPVSGLQFLNMITTDPPPPPPARADVYLPLSHSAEHAYLSDFEDREIIEIPSVFGRSSVETDVSSSGPSVVSVRPRLSQLESKLERSPRGWLPDVEWRRVVGTGEDNPSTGGSSGWDAPPLSPSYSDLSPQQSPSHSQGSGLNSKRSTSDAGSDTFSASATLCGSIEQPELQVEIQSCTTSASNTALEDPQTPSQTSSTASTRCSSPPRNTPANDPEPERPGQLEVDGRFSALVECFRAKRSKDGFSSYSFLRAVRDATEARAARVYLSGRMQTKGLYRISTLGGD